MENCGPVGARATGGAGAALPVGQRVQELDVVDLAGLLLGLGVGGPAVEAALALPPVEVYVVLAVDSCTVSSVLSFSCVINIFLLFNAYSVLRRTVKPTDQPKPTDGHVGS